VTPLVIALPGAETLAQGIVAACGFETGVLESRRFPDGEAYVRHRSTLAGRSVALLCSLNDPDPKLMTLLLAAAAARELGAVRVGLVAPYLPYMRQDKCFHEGETVSAKHFARILSERLDWLITVDPHLHRIRRLDEVYAIPSVALHAGPLLADWIKAEIPDPLLIGPDAESEQWVAAAARAIGAPYVVATKVRLDDVDVEITIPDLALWAWRTPVLVDDVASSGRTLLTSAKILSERGLRRPACVVIHGIFEGDAFKRLRSLCGPIVSVNTIAHVSNKIDASPLLAKAVGHMARL